MVVRPQISQDAPSSKFARPPQLPVIGLLLKTTPKAIATKDMLKMMRTDRNSTIRISMHQI